MKELDRFTITEWFKHLQDRICTSLEKQTGRVFLKKNFGKDPAVAVAEPE